MFDLSLLSFLFELSLLSLLLELSSLSDLFYFSFVLLVWLDLLFFLFFFLNGSVFLSKKIFYLSYFFFLRQVRHTRQVRRVSNLSKFLLFSGLSLSFSKRFGDSRRKENSENHDWRFSVSAPGTSNKLTRFIIETFWLLFSKNNSTF